MRLIKYTGDDGSTTAVNIDLAIGVYFHQKHPSVHEQKERLFFRFAGEREGMTICGAEAERVWNIVQRLMEN